jgi:hypothetical protein
MEVLIMSLPSLMVRKNEILRKAVMREMMRGYLKKNDIHPDFISKKMIYF